jgi:hypothetical protein
MTLNTLLFYKYNTTTVIWSISNSISIPRGLKSFMLKNCKVDFLGNSEVAFFFDNLYSLYTVVSSVLVLECRWLNFKQSIVHF